MATEGREARKGKSHQRNRLYVCGASEGVRKTVRARYGLECCEMHMSSGHDMAVAQRTHDVLWFSSQDLASQKTSMEK